MEMTFQYTDKYRHEIFQVPQTKPYMFYPDMDEIHALCCFHEGRAFSIKGELMVMYELSKGLFRSSYQVVSDPEPPSYPSGIEVRFVLGEPPVYTRKHQLVNASQTKSYEILVSDRYSSDIYSSLHQRLLNNRDVFEKSSQKINIRDVARYMETDSPSPRYFTIHLINHHEILYRYDDHSVSVSFSDYGMPPLPNDLAFSITFLQVLKHLILVELPCLKSCNAEIIMKTVLENKSVSECTLYFHKEGTTSRQW